MLEGVKKIQKTEKVVQTFVGKVKGGVLIIPALIEVANWKKKIHHFHFDFKINTPLQNQCPMQNRFPLKNRC